MRLWLQMNAGLLKWVKKLVYWVHRFVKVSMKRSNKKGVKTWWNSSAGFSVRAIRTSGYIPRFLTNLVRYLTNLVRNLTMVRRHFLDSINFFVTQNSSMSYGFQMWKNILEISSLSVFFNLICLDLVRNLTKLNTILGQLTQFSG